MDTKQLEQATEEAKEAFDNCAWLVDALADNVAAAKEVLAQIEKAKLEIKKLKEDELRDKIAIDAAFEIIRNNNGKLVKDKDLANAAYSFADAMLARRKA